MRTVMLVGMVGVVGLGVGITASTMAGTAFRPVQVTVDLTHTDQRGSLEGPWVLRPDRRFPGVMSARDQGQPVQVMVSLPAPQSYSVRLKLKFHRMDQAVEVLVNKVSVTTFRPSRLERAEKYSLAIPAQAVVAGSNQVTFINHGSAGGTEYELVRLQNYQVPLKKNRAYLVPAARAERAGQVPWRRVVPAAFAAWGLLGILVGGTMWMIRRISGVRPPTAARLAGLACLPAAVILLLPAVPWLVPYRVVMTPAYLWQLFIGLAVVGHALLFGPLLVWVGARWLASRHLIAGTAAVAHGVGRGSHAVSQQVVEQGTAAARVTVAGIRTGIVLLGRYLRWGVCTAWRWFLRQQYPQGYAKIFCGLAVLALASHWIFHWDRVAEPVSYLAGAALVIAIVWESLVSLKEEE